MSYPSNNQATARTRCPSHDGTAAAIRAALARSSEPLSCYRLFLATGIPVEKIRDALGAMLTRTGQVVSLKGPKGTVYTLYDKRPKADAPPAPGNIGRGWYHPEFRELHRDPFAHMKLAMLTRRG